MFSLLKIYVIFICTFGLSIFATATLASCTGCLCPGDPCNLCSLPAMQNDLIKPNESELCARIREKVPPTSAQPGSNEYFPNLDMSIMVCVNEGGDVIRNKQRNSEFPSRFYCKPPTSNPDSKK
ncbi:hypothetical protein C7H79_09265 [Nitrosomonas supralitoralis]|uniref:Uncharacterized protein n=1 Tax=Nitrosomonas supralitoralis TaxID=2116706 RepID=A0A2P7NUR7_9PROT|nr:hypothetical protein C7H79_09265 [Nitrosomonas supralitoralis]